MKKVITTEDKRLALSRWLSSSLKIQILNTDETVLDELIGFTDLGTISIDSSSYSRRVYNFTLVPTDQSIDVSEKSRIWIDKIAKVYIGLKTPRDTDYKWYSCGEFIFTNTTTSVNNADNSLTVNCGDLYKNLDGTCNGQLNALTTVIPAYEEDKDGNPTKYTVIREALFTILKDLGCLNPNKIFIDDIGEYKAMSQYNNDYENYRKENEHWNCVPYDLEYSAGDFISSIAENIIGLYPNYDMFFDENGNFIVQMIPSCLEDEIVLNNEEIQSMLLDEQCTTDLTKVRNIVHVWGQTFDVEWCTEDVSTSSSTNKVVYKATIANYTKNDYGNGDMVALKISPNHNANESYIAINNLGEVPIYDENSDTLLSSDYLKENSIYVFKFRKTTANGKIVKRFYLLGQWQAHGMCVLVDGSVNNTKYTCSDGTVTTLYTERYFCDKYNVSAILLKKDADSPYTVQKIGERIDVKSGNEYDYIPSDSLALARAEYELYKDARLTDNITITLASIIPWLDSYMKVRYKKINDTEEMEYLTQQVSLNLTEGTTSVTMSKFYPLYPVEEKMYALNLLN